MSAHATSAALPRSAPRRSAGRGSLLSQVLALNTVIIVGTVFTATVAANMDLEDSAGLQGFLIAAVAILATALVNGWLLRRRFRPLDDLVAELGEVDLERPSMLVPDRRGEAADVRRLRHAVQSMLGRLEQERRSRITAVLEAQETERARLARDLHDEVNQSLTGIMLRVSMVARDAGDELRPALEDVRDLTEQAMRELLRLSHALRPSALDDLGLRAALETRVREFAAESGLEVSSRVDDAAVVDLSPAQQTVVFRVAQEALSNVARHARARRVDVALACGAGGRPVLVVRDDGVGITATATSDGRAHAGLAGMRERALLVGGRIAVRSTASGTEVELRL